MTKIWAHTLVCNEENYLWYSVSSVIDYVDKILLWDTGSTDNTLKIVDELRKKYGRKIEFKEVGEVDPNRFTQIRQKMLDQTISEWFLIIDGDEVWSKESIKKLTGLIKGNRDTLDSIVSPNYNIIGDIYHYQEEKAGGYQIDNHRGHVNIRAINRCIPGLYFAKPHGQQGLFNKDNVLIQDLSKDRRKFLDYPYLHFTNMPRSTNGENDAKVPKRAEKLKLEIGKRFPKGFVYPEVFYQPSPLCVPSPWKKMSKQTYLASLLLTIPRKIKRRIFKSRSGY